MIEAPQILQRFAPISLAEMDGVKLMNRTDTKFTFNRASFNTILGEILEHYRILEINGKRLSRYKTLYFDTADLALYLRHHSGNLNRYKIRHRTYVESNAAYLEVKFKNNKGRTLKNRIKELQVPQNWNNDAGNFLRTAIPFEPELLKPAIWVNYSRLTLVNKNGGERLTIDLDLEFVNQLLTRQLPDLVIAEVKQEQRAASPFLKIMKKYHIREGSISKYCLGIALTSSGVKTNNFKPKLLQLKHLLHDELLLTNS